MNRNVLNRVFRIMESTALIWMTVFIPVAIFMADLLPSDKA